MTQSIFERLRTRVAALALATAGALSLWHFTPAAFVEAAPSPSVDTALVDRLDELSDRPSFADVVEAVKPSVVNIAVSGPRPAAQGMDPRSPHGAPGMPGMPFGDLEDFLRRFFEPQRHEGSDGPHFQGMGSGFIVDPEGYVVTNHHVVGDATEITVTLDDGRTLPASLVGSDPKTDLAVVKVESDEELPYARFGDSDAARAGDWVIAIGNPFGLGGSATAGIVSARGRDLQSGPFDDFIQIDAPINRGNSGGPLFDPSGRVIGINTAIFSPNGGNVGIGFAIPASLAEPIIEELKATGRVQRGWLGVAIQPVDEAIAESLGLDEAEGALVASVEPKSPAEKAGLVPGDIILGVDGDSIGDVKDLTRKVAGVKPDDNVELDVFRDGERMTLEAAVGRSPDARSADRRRSGADGSGDEKDLARLGLALGELTPELKARIGLPDDVQGALVARVEPGSSAAEKGLRPGDVILRVNSTKVEDAESAIRAIEEVKKDGRSGVLLRVQRGPAASFVAVPFA